jgi:membrane-associated HD superfamily phosphohydrolase
MLADSVEAAARAMDKPTPSALFSLVNDIVEAKLKDGQLDECPLTIKDLATVKQSFVSSLTTILHARIAYPTANDKDNSQNRESPDAAQGRP